jgi:hypothetical protein
VLFINYDKPMNCKDFLKNFIMNKIFFYKGNLKSDHCSLHRIVLLNYFKYLFIGIDFNNQDFIKYYQVHHHLLYIYFVDDNLSNFIYNYKTNLE